jgi:hypothetical protein
MAIAGSMDVESLLEQLHTSKSRVQQLETTVRELEAENQALKLQLAAITLPRVHLEEDDRQHQLLNTTFVPPLNTTSPAYQNLKQRPSGYQTPRRPPPTQPSRGITFRVESPQDQPTPGAKRQQNASERKLLDIAPKTELEWSRRREHLQLRDQRARIQTFFQLICCTGSLVPSSVRTGDEGSGVEALLQTYQTFVRGLRQHRDRAEQIVNFSTLLHVALCRVARHKGKVDVECVNRCMNDLLPPKQKSEKQAGYLQRLRASVLWPVSQAQKLRPWLWNRADELFLLCKTSVKALSTIPLTETRWTSDREISRTAR